MAWRCGWARRNDKGLCKAEVDGSLSQASEHPWALGQEELGSQTLPGWNQGSVGGSTD